MAFSSEHVHSDVKTLSEEDAAADAVGEALTIIFWSSWLTLKSELPLLHPVYSSSVFKLFDVILSISSVLNSFFFLSGFFLLIINLLVGPNLMSGNDSSRFGNSSSETILNLLL